MNPDTRLRIAFVGAGRRMGGVYLPVIRAMARHWDVVGCTTRNRDTGETSARTLGIPWFPDLAVLVRDAKPNVVALCVPPSANVGAAREAIRLGMAVLMETPVSPSLGEARRILREAETARAVVGVAEQKPSLPLEQFKRKVTAAGVLGRIVLAQNDFRSYDYHAIAQLRSYAATGVPCVSVRCLTRRHTLRPYLRAGDAPGSKKPRAEKWDFATVAMADGMVLAHNFSDAFKSTPFRIRPSLRLYGKAGSLVDDELSAVDERGETFAVRVEADPGEHPGQAARRLGVNIPGLGEITWENPFADLELSDDQVALASHLDAMRFAVTAGSPPLYSLREAVQDLEIISAMRVSALLGGSTINLPLNLLKVAAGVALSPPLWGEAARSLLLKASDRWKPDK